MAAARSKRVHPYRRLAWGVVIGYWLLAAAYVFVTSTIAAAGHWHWSMREAMLPRISDVVVFTFFAVCGGSVGSFLNVVVWRMPQGLSVNGHSFCPRCRHRLRVWDNVPVLGWLWLGGRCRDCRLPISSRYPIVEAAVAITFALVATMELYGWNLPYRPYPFRDVMAMPMITPDSIVPVVYHLVGLSIAWAMGLIRFDRHRIPTRLVVFAAVWLVGGMMLVPSLAIVPWQLTLPDGWYDRVLGSGPNRGHEGFEETIVSHFSDAAWFVQAFVRIITSVVAAGFFARVLSRSFCPQANLKTDPLGSQTHRLLDLVVMIAVVAVIVGWQSTSGVLLSASVIAVFTKAWFGRDRTDALGRFSLALPVALALQLLFWRPLMDWGYWPSGPRMLSKFGGENNVGINGDTTESSRGVLLGFALATLFIPLWLKEPSEPVVEQETAIEDEKVGGDEVN